MSFTPNHSYSYYTSSRQRQKRQYLLASAAVGLVLGVHSMPVVADPTIYYNATDTSGTWNWINNSNESGTSIPLRRGSLLTFMSNDLTPALTISNDQVDFRNPDASTTTNISGSTLVSSGGTLLLNNNSSDYNVRNSIGALSLSGGNAYFGNSNSSGTTTNTITGPITSSGTSSLDFSNDGTGNVSSTITGGITLSDGVLSADFHNNAGGNVTNTISGGIATNNGSSIDFTNHNSGNISNTISGGIAASDSGTTISIHNLGSGMLANNFSGGITAADGGRVDLGNFGAGTVTNDILGGITVSGTSSSLNMANTGSGTITNTISVGLTYTNSMSGAMSFLINALDNIIDNNDQFNNLNVTEDNIFGNVGGNGITNTTINDGFSANGSFAMFGNIGGDGTSNTTINGGVSTSNSSIILFRNIFGNGTVNNTINGGIVINDSAVGFGNFLLVNIPFENGVTNNTVNGGIVINSGYVTFASPQLGTTTNTIDTITMNNSDSMLYLGGGGATTNVDTLNWNNGTLSIAYVNNGFGNTTINTLNLGAGSLTLNLAGLDNTPPNSTQTILTVGNVTGDASDIVLQNTSPFTEVIATSGSPNGITVGEDGTVTVTLVPTATSTTTNHLDALAAANDLLPSLQSTTVNLENAFAATPYTMAKTRAYMAQIMNEHRKDSLEGLITALSNDQAGKFVKIRGDYRMFAAPYATHIRNNGLGSYMAGFKEKFYGILMGGTRYFKENGVTLLGMVGFGASKMQMDRSANSFTNGKNMMLGIDARKTFSDYIDFESNVSGIITKNNQWRQGNPTPSQSYIAKSNYKTYAISFKNEVGPIFKFGDGYSVKPDIGLQLNISKQTAINETSVATTFAQNYKAKVTRDGEVYGGLGFRKQWKSDQYEGKVTLKYEVGQKSGNGKSSSTIYNASTPGGFNSTGTKPSNFTQYINLYGSVLDMKNNIKIAPGVTITLQKGQNAVAGTIKIEQRF